jgi:sec-independent protein translocase protein TatA
MGWDAPWHWVILAIIVIALFGYKKMPDAARSLGRSLRVFKTEIKGMSEDDAKRDAAKTVEAPTPTPTPPPATPAPPAAPAPPAETSTSTPVQAKTDSSTGGE